MFNQNIWSILKCNPSTKRWTKHNFMSTFHVSVVFNDNFMKTMLKHNIYIYKNKRKNKGSHEMSALSFSYAFSATKAVIQFSVVFNDNFMKTKLKHNIYIYKNKRKNKGSHDMSALSVPYAFSATKAVIQFCTTIPQNTHNATFASHRYICT